MKKYFCVFSLLLAILLFSTTGCSAFRREGRTRAHTLMITGNYMNSRLLCDLAQYKTKQPILLFSQDAGNAQQIFFMPASSSVQQINADEFVDIVSFINPKRIVVVGGNEYVPQDFIDQIRAKFPVMIFNSEDWSQNARMLGELLNQRVLLKEFNDSKERLTKSGVIK